MSNPFDYVNAISTSKKQLIVDEITEKAYLPFIVNRALSYHLDTLFQANEMNQRHGASKHSQFQYLINTVRAKKRIPAKWHKQSSDADVDLVMRYYGYSQAKARQALDLLSAENLEIMKRLTDEGGRGKEK